MPEIPTQPAKNPERFRVPTPPNEGIHQGSNSLGFEVQESLPKPTFTPCPWRKQYVARTVGSDNPRGWHYRRYHFKHLRWKQRRDWLLAYSAPRAARGGDIDLEHVINAAELCPWGMLNGFSIGIDQLNAANFHGTIPRKDWNPV